MEILVNGAPREVPEGTTMAQLIEMLGLTGRRLAVEVNREIVPRSTFETHRVQPGDRIEIVHAIGGG
ncbi:MAG: sulfur carrier protein ThiS [Gammaproteobacteria bacterium]